MPEQRFTATLAEAGRGGGRWIEVPFDAKAVFGEARPPVAGTLNGTPFRSRLSVYGGVTYLGLNRETREAAGIEVGDPVEVVLDRDDAPREVDVPAELTAALEKDSGAKERFEALAFTHRKEYAQWVAEAKKPTTKARRIHETLKKLRDAS